MKYPLRLSLFAGMTETRLCNLCGLRLANSDEHLPGVGAGNTGPVRITYFRPSDEQGRRQHYERLERSGFVVRTLCRACNRRTGGNYGTAYKEFVEQFGASGVLDAGADRVWISLRQIQPLRVLKQMTSMFIAALGDIRGEYWETERRFVLARDAKLGGVPLRYFLYRTVGAGGRVTALVSLMSLYRRWPPIALCEIAWPPLGVVVALAEPEWVRHPLLANMKEVSDWGTYGFRERADFGFSVPLRRPVTHWPLGFGTERAAFDWSSRDGLIVSVGPSIGNDADAQVSVLTGRPPKTG